jgi:hypothetical protein
MFLQKFTARGCFYLLCSALFVFIVGATVLVSTGYPHARTLTGTNSDPVNQAFSRASRKYGVPVALLKAICYMEGHLSNNGEAPSIDGGYGCMHLVKNKHADTLDRAAQELRVTVAQLQQDLPTNILGGADILRDDALQLSGPHMLPTSLAGWYGAVAQYSDAEVRSTALLYANAAFQILNQGFQAPTDQGELVTLAAQAVKPITITASRFRAVSMAGASAKTLPGGCTTSSSAAIPVDYPGAVNCILPPADDCNTAAANQPCNYTGADRSKDFKIDFVVIHDIEGTASGALNVFQDPTNAESIHYIVDSDGTVYQVLQEKNIAYHDGNFWYNEHSIGVEHAGFAATGYKWYNATEYLASARLVAYLLNKYKIPLNRSHILAHGTVPSPSLSTSPNHVDPGPYWLWDYYINLIHQQGIGFPVGGAVSQTITLHPKTDQQPDSPHHVAETTGNFSFFYLYNGPSTRSGFIPEQESGDDSADVSDNVEPGIAYYFVKQQADAARTGDTMYEIWYGEADQAHAAKTNYSADAKMVWLAVPPGDGVVGHDKPVHKQVTLVSASKSAPQIYGRPTTDGRYVIGTAPVGAIFTTGYTIVEDGTSNLWYEINYNHRQAWIPANEVQPWL